MTALAITEAAQMLPALTPAARAAADLDSRELVERWYAGLGPSARRKYRLALHTFATWATGEKRPSGDLALRVLVAAGRASAHSMVCAWRDEMLAAGKRPQRSRPRARRSPRA